MNQYKSIFLGTVDPSSDFATLKRAVNTQKVRVLLPFTRDIPHAIGRFVYARVMRLGVEPGRRELRMRSMHISTLEERALTSSS